MRTKLAYISRLEGHASQRRGYTAGQMLIDISKLERHASQRRGYTAGVNDPERPRPFDFVQDRLRVALHI